MTLVVGTVNVRQKSRQSGVPASAGSPSTSGLSESTFAPYVSFGVLMTSKLWTNKFLMRYIAALVP